jgi:16S rRNA (adenine1518-N6/adenine1519-N6)-dimethyltransferase
MTFMVQWEVAERLIAKPGTKEYGYLSVYCQHKASIALRFKVPPACFSPRPKVLSAVLTLHPRARSERPEVEQHLMNIVKAAFSHRRKTILNSLQKQPQFESVAANLLEKAGIRATRRAEELGVDEYLHLAELMSHWRS